MGHPNCLKGKTFVITGTLDSLYRAEAEDYLKRHSGRVTGSVSGKTNFLLVGEGSGNSKVTQVLRASLQSCTHKPRRQQKIMTPTEWMLLSSFSSLVPCCRVCKQPIGVACCNQKEQAMIVST